MPPHLDRAGEEDLRHTIGLAERLADGSTAVHDAHEALGDAGTLEHLADPLAQKRREARGASGRRRFRPASAITTSSNGIDHG